jgi:hypothetical protein
VHTLRRSQVLLGSAIAATLLVGTTIAADASTIPAWKFAKSDGATSFTSLLPLTPHSVWGVGTRNGSLWQAQAAHWDGRAWTATPLPSPFSKPARQKTELTLVTGTATDLWAFGVAGNDTYALHRVGGKWKVARRWANSSGAQAHVFGPGDVSVITLGYHAQLWHFDGKAWALKSAPVSFPLNSSATSNSDMWAVCDGQVPVAHWDGTTWSPVQLPALPPSALGPMFRGVLAQSADDVWIVGTRNQPAKGGFDSVPLALHWDGHTWQRHDPPGLGNLYSVAPDGHGGIWVGTDAAPEHYSAGKWTRTTLPRPKRNGSFVSIWTMSPVPRTGIMWATAGIRDAHSGFTVSSALLTVG